MNKALKDFIKVNHGIPVEYWRLCYKRFTCVAETPYERLRAIFLDAIDTSGGQTRLDGKLESIRRFHEKINKCFNNKSSDFYNFCRSLIGSKFKEGEIVEKL